VSYGHTLIHSDFGDESFGGSVPPANFKESRIHIVESNPRVRLRDKRVKSDGPVLYFRTFKESG
jgi:hypothetical protein